MIKDLEKRVIVTGGAGFLGGAVCAALHRTGITDVFVPRQRDYDLTTAEACRRLYRDAFDGQPAHWVIHLAAEVGGIGANQAQPGRFFYANMAMALHLIEEFRLTGWHEQDAKFVQAGTVCSYPARTAVPFHEEQLWDGYPEQTNAPYGVAKRAAWQMLDAYCTQYGMQSVYVIPTNLYGPWDNFDPATSHVIPALIRKCCGGLARDDETIVAWGTGEASREFLYVDDAAEGIVRAAEAMIDPAPVNLGTGDEIRICDLAALIAELTGFRGNIEWDPARPDGQLRRRLDVGRAWDMFGWRSTVGLRDGLLRTIDWYRSR